MTKARFILLTLFLVLLTLLGDQGGWRLYRLKQISHRLQSDNLSLGQQNSELVAEIGRLQDSEYLERLIREERGYLRDDELLLEIPKSP